MSDYLDFLVIWAPIVCLVTSFLVVGTIISRGETGIEKFKNFVRIFLSEPATLKTWALVGAAPVICLILSGVVAKVASDVSWPRSDPVSMARIRFFNEIAIGLELLLSIVLGALGAVTFKGQGPGGTSFQVNPDGSASGTAPAPPVDKPKE